VQHSAKTHNDSDNGFALVLARINTLPHAKKTDRIRPVDLVPDLRQLPPVQSRPINMTTNGCRRFYCLYRRHQTAGSPSWHINQQHNDNDWKETKMSTCQGFGSNATVTVRRFYTWRESLALKN